VDQRVYGSVLRYASRIVPVSEAVKREIARSYPGSVSSEIVTPLQNAVDSRRISGDGVPPERREHPGGPPTILSVTRFIRVKGIETTVRTFARVKSRIPDAKLVIVGPGDNERNEYYRSIRKLIGELGVEGITITGRLGRRELAGCYSSANVLLHTPVTLRDDFEASGLILLEAGLFGIPVVATRSGGVPEVISDGVNGLLADEGDVEQLADLVTELLHDRGKASLLGKNNRRTAQKRNWEWYAGMQNGIYREVLSAAKG